MLTRVVALLVSSICHVVGLVNHNVYKDGSIVCVHLCYVLWTQYDYVYIVYYINGVPITKCIFSHVMYCLYI